MRPFLTATLFVTAFTSFAFAGDPVNLLVDTKSKTEELLPAVAEQPLPLAPASTNKEEPLKQVETAKAAGPDKVELAAIYYYAEQKAEARVQAEFRRLKHKYPAFEMPADLYTPAAAKAVDEKALWVLYEKGDITGAEAEMARRTATIAGWKPSEDFSRKFARMKLRKSIEVATKAKAWQAVAAAGSELDPATEKEPDLLWSYIDALAALKQTDRLASVYRSMLFREPQNVLAKKDIITTIEKATRDFSPADVRAVVAQFSTDPIIAAGLGKVTEDLVRRNVADFNGDDSRKDALPTEEIAPLIEAARRDERPADMSLIGWYELKIGNPAEAGAWFRRALSAEANAEHAKGLYLALVKQDRQQEAFDVALAHRQALASDPVFLMNALAERFAKPETGAIDPAAMQAYSEAILANKSADHSEILAWYAYNSAQYEASRAWFTKSVGWKVSEARVKGLALSMAQMGDRQGLIALYRTYGTQYPSIWDDIHLAKPGKGRKQRPKENASFIDRMEVGAVTPVEGNRVARDPAVATPQRATIDNGYLAAFKAKRYGDCLMALQSGALSADQALIKGWCLLGLKRASEARSAFSQALAGRGNTQADAAYGLTLVLLQAKLTDDALSVVNLYPMTESRKHEVLSEIYFQKARSAFDAKNFQATLDALNARIAIAPEPGNLSQLRGWAHFNLGHLAEAREIFRRLDQHMDDPGVRRGVEATFGNVQGAPR